ncbi:MAG TPA: M24 family metallopeptidase [Chloroflexota bacterium]|nr:M24 family metallopeptidase [Chloroflexota bacterium]
MAQTLSTGPRLSLAERDRRYAAIREQLRARGVDCLIVTGSDLFYLTNHLPGEQVGLLPTEGDAAPTVQLNGRHLVDVSPQVLLEAQDWINDVRANGDAMAARVKELGLERGTIGLTRTRAGVGGLGHGFYTELQAAFPQAKLVDVSDILINLRTIKSEEEIALIDRANRLFDIAVARVQEFARPGMRGSIVVGEAQRAMVEAGGDVESEVGFNFGPQAHQNPILAEVCLDREIQPGDIGTLTAHAEYQHYAGHSDAVISFGEPRPLHRALFEAAVRVREKVLATFRDGATHDQVIAAYQQACTDEGFRWSPHGQIHQYGIDVPEFAGPAFRVAKQNGGGGGGGRPDITLRAGMIYSVSPTVVANDCEDRIVCGTSLVVTADGYRELGDRKMELLIAGS